MEHGFYRRCSDGPPKFEGIKTLNFGGLSVGNTIPIGIQSVASKPMTFSIRVVRNASLVHLQLASARLPRWGLAFAFTACWSLWSGSLSNRISVQIRPEAVLLQQADATLLLKVRLGQDARAMLWKATTCDVPNPAAYVIARSGIYTIPLKMLPGPAEAVACFASSDGALAVSAPPNRTMH